MAVSDVRYAFRVLRRAPAFTAFAALTLALGIGASTSMFSVVHSVLLNPVRYADPDRVVALNTTWLKTGALTTRVTAGDWRDLAGLTDVFDAVAAYDGGEVGVQLRNRADFAGTYFVTPGFFRVFSAVPLRGRLLNDADTKRSAAVSAGFAQRAFGGVDEAIGQYVRVDAKAYEIAGVMPSGFEFPAKADVWVADALEPGDVERTAFNYRAIARLKPGVSLAAAQARLNALGVQLAKAYPASNKDKSFSAIPIRDQLVRNVRSTILVLMGAVVLVLLISCANVAHLLLARAVGRAREFAVRAAVGASRRRMFVQLLTESVVLGIAGGLLGILIAFAGVRAFLWLAPANLPRLNEVHVDWSVLAFGIVLSLASSVLFGFAPAWQAAGVDVQEGLRQAANRGTVGGTSTRFRNALVIGEIALSFALAIGAGLMVRSFVALNEVSLGFHTEGILVVYAHNPASSLPEHLASSRFFERLLDELHAMPGVKSSAVVMGLPTGQHGSNGSYVVPGQTMSTPNLPNAGFRLASENYFSTIGIPFLRGRDFNVRDQHDAPYVAIVSEALVRRSFPHQDPIGKQIMCGLDAPMKWLTIVGVVGDVRSNSPVIAPEPELYMPFQQHPYFANELQVVVRTDGDPAALQIPVERKIRGMSPLVATKFTTLHAMVSDVVATPRFRTVLVSVFAGIAVLLAMAGVYGVMSYMVSQRTPELGLRMALGASPGGIVQEVLKRAAKLAAAGLVIGMALSLASSRLLQSLLFGLETTDLATYTIAVVALGLITLAAAAVPVWRAATIDPAIALRQE